MSLPVTVNVDGTPIPNVKNIEKVSILNPIDTHCNLNILDSYKDATHEHPPAHRVNLFKDSIKKLYTCYSDSNKYSDKELHIMEDYFLTDQNNRGTELRICALSKSATNTDDLNKEIEEYVNNKKTLIPDFISSSIPETYKYALNDAAITPNDFRPGIEEIETPASFIDPGGRGKASIWPAINQELYIDLTNFGFNGIEFISKFLNYPNEIICSIRIVKDNIEILNVLVNRKGHILRGVQQYFEGNVTKNIFLTTQPNNLTNQKHALNYVLGKELGDTLQVIIGYIMMKYNPNLFESEQSKVAAFTGDIPFACRCMMLNVPVILRRLKLNSKDSVLKHYSYYIPKSLSEEEKYKIVHKAKIDDILKHNNGVKFRNNAFITKPDIEEYIDRGSKFTNEDKIKFIIVNLLRSVNEFIDEINGYLTELRNTKFQDDNTEVHEQYRAFDVVTVINKKKLKLNPFLDRLMSDNIEGDPIRTILTGGGFNLTGDYYKSIKGTFKQQGRSSRLNGGGGQPHTKTEIEIKEKYILEKYIREDYPYYVFDILFNYFKFVGGTIISNEFITNLIEHVFEKKSLPTLNQFKILYDGFKLNFDMFENVEKEIMIDSSNIFESNTLFLLYTISNYFVESIEKTKKNDVPKDDVQKVPKFSKTSFKSKKKPTARDFRTRDSVARDFMARDFMASDFTTSDFTTRDFTTRDSMEVDDLAEGGNKNKTRKHKTRKHKTRKHKTRKHKPRKHKPRKHKTRKHKTRKNRK